MARLSIWDILIYTLLLIAVVSFPVEQFVSDVYIYYTIEIALRALLCLYFCIMLYRGNYFRVANRKIKWKNLLYLSPVCLCLTFTLIYYLFNKDTINPTFSILFLFETIMALLTAINEELIFRLMFHRFLQIENKLKKILVSSLIFALFHSLNFISTFNPYTLIDIAYAFGIGVILCFIFEYGDNVFPCIIYHFLYNFLNQVLFSALFHGVNYSYYFIGGALVVIVGGYLGLIYFFYFKKRIAYND